MKVAVRNLKQLGLMRRSGIITATTLQVVIQSAKPGVSLVELDRIAQEQVLGLGGQPSFKSVPGYRFTTCLTLNDEVVHGIPRPIKLAEGDILGIDLGAVYKGWHTDAAWSIMIGSPAYAKASVGKQKSEVGDRVEKEKFLKIGEEALWQGVSRAVEGKRIGDISEAIQTVIENAGYSVVRALVGHGVGKALHEEPEVPGFGQAGTGLELQAGMTLAIEAIYTAGDFEVVLRDDGWTITSADGSLGGLFEMTVVVGKEKAEVLTDWREV